MEKKTVVVQNKGMTRDYSISKSSNEYAYENFNIRIIARDHDTLLSVTNEKGNTPIPLKDEDNNSIDLSGHILVGHCVLNQYLVLFFHTEGNTDKIYRVEYVSSKEIEDGRYVGKKLFSGNLGFDTLHPLETIADYESETVQKIYWVDGINQPRVINIMSDSVTVDTGTVYTKYDFITSFSTLINAEIEQLYSGGQFSPGSVQYFFTYSSEYLQETSVVSWTPHYYITREDRGIAADDFGSNSFKITISNYDTSFDFINIYRVTYTSGIALDKIAQLSLNNSPDPSHLIFIDTGTSQESLDPAVLNYIGGREITAETLCSKDDTLFLGGLKILSSELNDNIVTALLKERNGDNTSNYLRVEYTDSIPGGGGKYPYSIRASLLSGQYSYINSLTDNSSITQIFKGGNKYRIGIVFITNTGEKSSVYWVGDIVIDKYPVYDSENLQYKRAVIVFTPDDKLRAAASEYSYMCLVRAIVQSTSDSNIIAQGIVNPTLFCISDRCNNSPYAQPDWHISPMVIGDSSYHLNQLGCGSSLDTDVQNNIVKSAPYYTADEVAKYLNGNRVLNKLLILSVKKTDNNPGEGKFEAILYVVNQVEGDDKAITYTCHNQCYIDSHSSSYITGALYDWLYNLAGTPYYMNVGLLGSKDDNGVFFNSTRSLILHTTKDNDWVDYIVGGASNHNTTYGVLFPFLDTRHKTAGELNKEISGSGINMCVETGYDKGKPVVTKLPMSAPEDLYGNDVAKRWMSDKKIYNNFYEDWNIVDFYSPDITSESNTVSGNVKFRPVGLVSITGRTFDFQLNVDNTFNYVQYTDLHPNYNIDNPSSVGVYPVKAYPGYYGTALQNSNSDKLGLAVIMMFPWHKEYSIVQVDKTAEGEYVGVINKKIMANRLFGGITTYFDSSLLSDINNDEDGAFTYSVQATPGGEEGADSTTIEGSSSKIYYNKLDTLQIQEIASGEANPDNYYIYSLSGISPADNLSIIEDSQIIPQITYNDDGSFSTSNYASIVSTTDPIRIKYKSLPHTILNLGQFSQGGNFGLRTIPNIYVEEPGLNGLRSEFNTIGGDYEAYVPWETYGDNNEIAFNVVGNTENSVWFTGELSTSSDQQYFTVNLTQEKAEAVKENNIIISSDGILHCVYVSNVEIIAIDPPEFQAASVTANVASVENPEDKFNVTISADYSIEAADVTVSYILYKVMEESEVTVSSGDLILSGDSYNTIVQSDFFSDNENKSSVFFRAEITAHLTNTGGRYNSDSVTVTVQSPEYPYPESTEEPEEPTEPVTSSIRSLRVSEERESVVWRYRLQIKEEEKEGSYVFFVIDTEQLYQMNEAHDNISEYAISGLSIQNVYIPLRNSNSVIKSSTYVILGELYTDFTGEEYGGTSDYALEGNTFVYSGNPVPLSSNEAVASEGDWYFQRFDSLRTLPVSDTDHNQIIDIFSFLCETKINIGGRYDRRRTFSDIANTTQENFNVINNIYSQQQYIMTGAILNRKYSEDWFPSQITWSKTKTALANTDTWTNITLASTLNLDGNKGPVRAIRRFQNSLIAFQDKGIAEILYNSRTQLSTTQGVPIEIANSGKVDGKRYITDKAGCVNKWSIVETTKGIYFIDNINSSISVFNGGVVSLSDTKGFKNWIGQNTSINKWTPESFENYVTYWDRLNDDVYFVGGDSKGQLNVLCYNELLQQFTSFFDYGNVSMMVNLEDRFVSFKDKLWEQGTGEYLSIFGEPQDFYTLYKVTPDPYGDKIFSTLEYRADIFDMDNQESEGILTSETFDALRVWNEYQDTGEVPLEFNSIDAYPDKRRKFRIWRTDIPREAINDDNPHGLNRIRNPWIYLKLIKKNSGNKRAVFHDLQVKYYE